MSMNKIDGILEIPISGPPEEPICIYLSRQVTNNVKARYEDWLEGRARRRVFKFKEECNAKEYQDSMDAVARQAAAGTFEWSGDAWEVSLRQWPGIVKMIQLLSEDADQKLEAANKPPQKLTEDTIYSWTSDEVTGGVLQMALKEVISASPNFRSPPIRGKDG